MPVKNPFAKYSPKQLATVAVVAVFLILPFTTPLAVFLGTSLSHLSLFKVWKEIVLILVALIILFGGMYKPLARIQDRSLKILFWLILAYAGWTLLLGLLNLTALDRINWEAFIYASIVNLRFLFFLILCWLVAQSNALLKEKWQKLLLIPAGIVVAFGLLQTWVLPPNILEHIGYGPETITAYQTVDQNPEYVRIQSTLRGPNPLGAYLIMIIATLVVGLRKRRWTQAALLVGSLVVMFYSFSRSAWLGLIVTLGVLVYISINSSNVRRNLAVVGVVTLLLLGGSIYLARDNQFVQKTIFHTDETSLSPQSSNEQRAGAIQSGLNDVAHEPFGRGPGSAGPASLRNDQPERIAENYYLQIGQEIGWVGLLLFLAINVQIAILLWRRRSAVLARTLIASLAGITLVNLVSHAWTDETLSLLWWGLAGICLALVIPHNLSNQSRRQDI